MKLRQLLIIILLLPLAATAVTQQDVVGFWTFNLEPGFNLVSFPVLPENPTIQNVLSDKIGSAEITSWDNRLGRYRYSKFNSETDRWEGDLYVLNRGIAYWIYNGNDEPQRLIVSGRPEQYTKFDWSQLDNGWSFYAPTIGKSESLRDHPPANPNDLLITWNSIESRFDLIEATPEGWAPGYIDEFRADRSYLMYLNARQARHVGPPTALEVNYRPTDGSDPNGGSYREPPRPLVVGNENGLPLCNPDGGVCSGGFSVQVIRESGDDIPQVMMEQVVAPGDADAGKFRMALTIGGTIQPGDQVYLLVQGAEGAETRSVSFTIPAAERFIRDISFPEPMSKPGDPALTPKQFALSSPYPNPFNDRFQIELQLPDAEAVTYTLYDIQGREALTVGKHLSAGVHRLSISAPDQLSAGIYFLEMKAGANQGVAKVAYIK